MSISSFPNNFLYFQSLCWKWQLRVKKAEVVPVWIKRVFRKESPFDYLFVSVVNFNLLWHLKWWASFVILMKIQDDLYLVIPSVSVQFIVMKRRIKSWGISNSHFGVVPAPGHDSLCCSWQTWSSKSWWIMVVDISDFPLTAYYVPALYLLLKSSSNSTPEYCLQQYMPIASCSSHHGHLKWLSTSLYGRLNRSQYSSQGLDRQFASHVWWAIPINRA